MSTAAKRRGWLASGLLTFALCVIGHSLVTPLSAAVPTELVVESARVVQSLPGSDTTVLYLTLRNDGARADRLVAASTPAASMVHLHAGQLKGGVNSMRSVSGFDVPAHGRLQLSVGGDHLMLMGLAGPLKPGSRVKLTLMFEHAADLEVDVPVVELTGN